MTDFQLIDEKEGRVAEISKYGEQYVAPRFYSDPYYISVAVAATPYEVVPSIAEKRFVITGLLIASDRTFGTSTTAETITIYEANAADLSTNLKTVFRLDMLRNDRLAATSLNLRLSNARSVVAIATDNSVDVTLAGYYIDN